MNATHNPAEFRAWLMADPSRAVAWIDDIMTPEEVVLDFPALCGSVNTLANWRCKGKGPRYIPGNTVKYRRLDVLAYLESLVVDPAESRIARRRLRAV